MATRVLPVFAHGAGQPAVAPRPDMAANRLDVCLCYLTVTSAKEAVTIARRAVELGAAAAANVMPTGRSIFLWDGGLRDREESVVVFKTVRARVEELEALVVDMHDYVCPGFLVVPVTGGHEPYLDWIRQTLATAPER